MPDKLSVRVRKFPMFKRPEQVISVRGRRELRQKLKQVARLARFERTTACLEGRCYIKANNV